MSDAVTTDDRYRDELIRRTVCVGASKDELSLFLAISRRLGLDPLTRQIHVVRRWDSRLRREVMAVQVGIDGLRAVAHRTGEMDGYDPPQWCGPDGVWRDVWLAAEPPVAARVTVYRRGHAHGYTAVALWSEYAQRGRDGALMGLWARMPALMLSKCAEALALRRAFPAELAGVYEPAEMDQADDVPAVASTDPELEIEQQTVSAESDSEESGMTEAQRRYMMALCNELQLDREARLQLAREVTGRNITSARDLTQREASALIDRLRRMPRPVSAHQ